MSAVLRVLFIIAMMALKFLAYRWIANAILRRMLNASAARIDAKTPTKTYTLPKNEFYL